MSPVTKYIIACKKARESETLWWTVGRRGSVRARLPGQCWLLDCRWLSERMASAEPLACTVGTDDRMEGTRYDRLASSPKRPPVWMNSTCTEATNSFQTPPPRGRAPHASDRSRHGRPC